MLPKWAMILRVGLFPLDTLFWVMSQTRGYQIDKDVWVIGGVEYSDRSLYLLSKAQGETYRITRKDNVIHIEQV
jgi:hypothetical protein